MPSAPGSTMERARFGERLRDLRTSAALGSVQAAQMVGISQSKLSKIETGRLRPDPEDIAALCEIYDVGPDDRQELIKIAHSLRAVGRQSTVTLSRSAVRTQERIGRIESRATTVRSFQPTMVIGLLQTKEYVRAVMAEDLSGDELEAAIKTRFKRQSGLDDLDKEFIFVMSEGALRWQVGGPRIMAEQIEALIAAIRRPNVQLGIVPWTTQVNATTTHGFHLYDKAAVIFGTQTATGVLDTDDDIDAYTELFTHLENLACFGDDARRELLRIASDYRLLDR